MHQQKLSLCRAPKSLQIMHIPLLAKSMGFEMFRQTSRDLKSKSVRINGHTTYPKSKNTSDSDACYVSKVWQFVFIWAGLAVFYKSEPI